MSVRLDLASLFCIVRSSLNNYTLRPPTDTILIGIASDKTPYSFSVHQHSKAQGRQRKHDRQSQGPAASLPLSVIHAVSNMRPRFHKLVGCLEQQEAP